MYTDKYNIIIDNIDLISGSMSIYMEHIIVDDQGTQIAKVSKERRAFLPEDGKSNLLSWVEEKAKEKNVTIDKNTVENVIDTLWKSKND